MVSKKTTASKLKASENKTDASVAEPKKKVSSSKSAAAKTSAVSKTNAKKATTKQLVTETNNVDVVGEVLSVKSPNNAKKSSRSAKAVEVKAETPAAVEKSKKTVSATTKRSSVKENAKIAEAKKFAEMKEHPVDIDTIDEACTQGCCGGAWCSWLHAYKNMFNFKGRTSRYEFWSFMLINIFVLLLFSLGLEFITSSMLSTVFGVVIYLIQIMVYLSIFTRRLHDAGYSAWKGFFRPLLISWVLTFASAFYIALYTPTNPYALQLSLLVAAVFLITYGYYCIKTFIAAGFFEEERNANVYGAASFIDDAHKMRGLRYASIYLLIIIFGYLISLSSVVYSTLQELYAY